MFCSVSSLTSFCFSLCSSRALRVEMRALGCHRACSVLGSVTVPEACCVPPVPERVYSRLPLIFVI